MIKKGSPKVGHFWTMVIISFEFYPESKKGGQIELIITTSEENICIPDQFLQAQTWWNAVCKHFRIH